MILSSIKSIIQYKEYFYMSAIVNGSTPTPQVSIKRFLKRNLANVGMAQ